MGLIGRSAGAPAGNAHGDGDGLPWGAVDSLRRLSADGASEQTPLLGNGGTTDTRKASVWEGEADFEGVVWWRKPSVSSNQNASKYGRLTSPGRLAFTSILPLRACIGRNRCS